MKGYTLQKVHKRQHEAIGQRLFELFTFGERKTVEPNELLLSMEKVAEGHPRCERVRLLIDFVRESYVKGDLAIDRADLLHILSDPEADDLHQDDIERLFMIIASDPEVGITRADAAEFDAETGGGKDTYFLDMLFKHAGSYETITKQDFVDFFKNLVQI